MGENSRLRNFVFTWNNYPQTYVETLKSLPSCTYIIYGREVGESGTPHIQGYVELEKQVRFPTLKKLLPKVHIENRKGTSLQAADYCKKDGDYVEEGTLSAPGKRNDLDQVREILQTGGEREVMDQATSVTAVRFAQMYLKVKETKRRFKPTVIWLFGKAGTGKTRTAMFDAFRRGYGEDVHLQCGQGKWWEGYDAHKVVIIDDLRDDFFSFTRMLNVLDRYECRVENKGGSRQLLARVIYITCPKPPENVWNTNEEIRQLERRIDVIQEIISDTDYNIIKGNAINQEKPENYPEEDNEETEGVPGGETVCKTHETQSGNETELDAPQ